MSQVIPYEWRDNKKKSRAIKCLHCVHRFRNNGKTAFKCYNNSVTFFNVEKNSCPNFKDYRNLPEFQELQINNLLKKCK